MDKHTHSTVYENEVVRPLGWHPSSLDNGGREHWSNRHGKRLPEPAASHFAPEGYEWKEGSKWHSEPWQYASSWDGSFLQEETKVKEEQQGKEGVRMRPWKREMTPAVPKLKPKPEEMPGKVVGSPSPQASAPEPLPKHHMDLSGDVKISGVEVIGLGIKEWRHSGDPAAKYEFKVGGNEAANYSTNSVTLSNHNLAIEGDFKVAHPGEIKRANIQPDEFRGLWETRGEGEGEDQRLTKTKPGAFDFDWIEFEKGDAHRGVDMRGVEDQSDSGYQLSLSLNRKNKVFPVEEKLLAKNQPYMSIRFLDRGGKKLMMAKAFYIRFLNHTRCKISEFLEERYQEEMEAAWNYYHDEHERDNPEESVFLCHVLEGERTKRRFGQLWKFPVEATVLKFLKQPNGEYILSLNNKPISLSKKNIIVDEVKNDRTKSDGITKPAQLTIILNPPMTHESPSKYIISFQNETEKTAFRALVIPAGRVAAGGGKKSTRRTKKRRTKKRHNTKRRTKKRRNTKRRTKKRRNTKRRTRRR